MHFPDLMRPAGIKKYPLGSGCFTGVNVRHNPDISYFIQTYARDGLRFYFVLFQRLWLLLFRNRRLDLTGGFRRFFFGRGWLIVILLRRTAVNRSPFRRIFRDNLFRWPLNFLFR